MMKRIFKICAIAASCALLLCGCGGRTETKPEKETPTVKSEETDDNLQELTENAIGAAITLTSGETIEIELYPDIAPKTVANFIKLANEGFYNGTIFHRAVDGFVVQAGGYDAEYNLKSVSETVEGEFSENGIDNPLSHERGVISMARIPSENDSASSQFFIVVGDSTYLDGQYAAFGRVTSGMDVADTIAKAPKMQDPPPGMDDLPEDIFEIQSVTINN